MSSARGTYIACSLLLVGMAVYWFAIGEPWAGLLAVGAQVLLAASYVRFVRHMRELTAHHRAVLRKLESDLSKP